MKYKMNKFHILLIIAIIMFSFSSCERKSGRKTNSRPIKTYSKKEPVTKKQSGIGEPQSARLPLNQLFKKYQSAVFMVFTSDGLLDYQGSGFFISADGVAVCNYHVFEGTTKGMEIIKTANGQELKVERVLAQSTEDDFIIFKVRLNSKVQFTPIPIAQRNPEIGEDVFAIGNPRGLENTLSKGIVSGYRDNGNLIQTTTEITHGSSGGPLLNMQGEVVGITTAGVGEANLNFAVNIKLLNLNRYLSQYTKNYQPGHSYIAHVKRVIDGDTFVIETDERVRLIGIDTPETVHPRRDVEPFGPEATEFTKNAIEGKYVRLEFDVEIYDMFKRLLAYVYVDDVLLNEQLLLEGLAVISTYPPNVKYVERFLEQQKIAQKRGIGIWSNI